MKSDRITIRDIAGFCPEEAVWKMMADVSASLLKEKSCYCLTPESVIVDGYNFIVETDHSIVGEFMAPEQDGSEMTKASQMVWSLGAIAYYMATGHVVFGGHGSAYQKEHVSAPLPVLPKGLQMLTPVVQKCLNYSPDNRISLNELIELTEKGLASCEKQQRKDKPSTSKVQENKSGIIGDKWPEEMIER